MPESPPVASAQDHHSASAGKVRRRAEFLEHCGSATRRIHEPILDLLETRGHLNPAGLGEARALASEGSVGQSSVGFETLALYAAADEAGRAAYGGAEYAIVKTPEADAVCAKFAALHGGAGAVICPSGLSAIATTIDAFAPAVLLVPESIYYPAYRYMSEANRAEIRVYPANASGENVAGLLAEASARAAPSDILLYLEAPGSGTFEIPDIAGMVAAAHGAGVRTVMDNTWASHVRFKPLAHGIDIVVQATTKYEGGYGDTPSGVVVARGEADLARLARRLRISGNGAVSPQTCLRLLDRMETTAARLDRHEATANALMEWFERQPFVAEIFSPVRVGSPDHERFKTYFSGGNGLFTVAFKAGLSVERVSDFIDALLLFRVAESWGGHVSLVLPMHPPHRDARMLAAGKLFRFHAGLEDVGDLLNDLEQAMRHLQV